MEKTFFNTSNKIRSIKKQKKAIQKENELIKKEKKAMRKEIEKLIDKVGNTTNNNNLLQQNVYINNYGNENLDYLTEGYLTSLLKIIMEGYLKQKKIKIIIYLLIIK